MSPRSFHLALIAIVLASSTGCCHTCWPCGDTWCDSQCGQFFWHEWFSFPPDCCEPCDCCGDFVGSRNPWVRRGPPPMGRPNGYGDGYGESYGYAEQNGSGQQFGPADGEMIYSQPPRMQPTPYRQPRMQPTPAQPPRMQPTPAQPRMQPGPGDEMPLPGPSAKRYYRNELGQVIKNDGTVDSSRTSRRLEVRQPREIDR